MRKTSAYAVNVALVVSAVILSFTGAAIYPLEGDTNVCGEVYEILDIKIPPVMVQIPLCPGKIAFTWRPAYVTANVEWCIYAEDSSDWPFPYEANGHMKRVNLVGVPIGGELKEAIKVRAYCSEIVEIPSDGSAVLVYCSDDSGDELGKDMIYLTWYYQLATFMDWPGMYSITINWHIEPKY
jgi:hypothetical protein